MGGKSGKDSHWSCGSLCYCGTKHGKIRVKTQHQTNIISGLQLQSYKDHLFTSSSLWFQARAACCFHLGAATRRELKVLLSKAHTQNNHLSSWSRDPACCGYGKCNHGTLEEPQRFILPKQRHDTLKKRVPTILLLTSKRYQTWPYQSWIFLKHLELNFSAVSQ